MSNKFNYAIGFRWNEANPDGSIGTYSFCSCEVFFGTLESAKEALEVAKIGCDKSKRTYRIYKLTEVMKEANKSFIDAYYEKHKDNRHLGDLVNLYIARFDVESHGGVTKDIDACIDRLEKGGMQ